MEQFKAAADIDVQAKIDAPSGSTDVLFSKAFARAFHQFVMRHSPPDDCRPDGRHADTRPGYEGQPGAAARHGRHYIDDQHRQHRRSHEIGRASCRERVSSPV